jgi:hypothetical protein
MFANANLIGMFLIRKPYSGFAGSNPKSMNTSEKLLWPPPRPQPRSSTSTSTSTVAPSGSDGAPTAARA